MQISAGVSGCCSKNVPLEEGVVHSTSRVE